MSGAVDPLPFVLKSSLPDLTSYPLTYRNTEAKVKVKKATLRRSPTDKAPVLGYISQDDEVAIMGQHKQWLHVRTMQGTRAFVHQSLLR